MIRNVKGTLFSDYVRMLRAKKGVDWSRYLTPEDLVHLGQRVSSSEWYPMETFERMGLAILAEITGGNLEMVRAWGRMQIDGLYQLHPTLVALGDPRDSIMRFQVLRRSFFDYQALEITSLSDGECTIDVRYGMGNAAEEAASHQTLGFFERLLEVSGARDVKAWFSSKSWAGDGATTIQLRWA